MLMRCVVRVHAPTVQFQMETFMKFVMAFIAGAMFLSSAFANDPAAAARFKMKTGRELPAVEASATKPAKAETSCDKHGCCSRKEQAATANAPTQGDPMSDARFRMKYGRPSPNEEARIAAAARAKSEQTLVASSAHDCDGDCCKHHM
jgi:hypothetical protein